MAKHTYILKYGCRIRLAWHLKRMHMSLKIRTGRLELIAETADPAATEEAGLRHAGDVLDAAVPEDWPLEDRLMWRCFL